MLELRSLVNRSTFNFHKSSWKKQKKISQKNYTFGGLRKKSGCITDLDHSWYLPDHQGGCDSRGTKRMDVVILFLRPETARLLTSRVRASDFLKSRPRGLTGADPWNRSGNLRQGSGTDYILPWFTLIFRDLPEFILIYLDLPGFTLI